MIFLVDQWIAEFVSKVKNAFGNEVIFIGLQGSYRRKEASDSSDIDMVVILKELNVEELKKYREIIPQMPNKEKACGFISGQDELQNWEKSELFQFYHDTQPIYGSLNDLLPLINKVEVRRAIKIGACNLYHASCHNFIYERSTEALSALYKAAFFILQAKYFDETDQYESAKARLQQLLNDTDKEILSICIDRKKLTTVNEDAFDEYSAKMIAWSSDLLRSYP